MKFGRVPVTMAAGAILGHSVKTGGRKLAKGHVLTPDDIAELMQERVGELLVARLDPQDMHEDAAAEAIGTAATGENVRTGKAFTGRVNLYATVDGIAVVDVAQVDALNLADEAITIATVAPWQRVERSQMLATIKIIPFAAPRTAVATAVEIASAPPLVRIAAFAPRRIGLISTLLPDTKTSVVDKTEAIMRRRAEGMGSRLDSTMRVAHEEAPIAGALAQMKREGVDPIVVVGASATVDRRDVVPAALVDAGGVIEHFGMPVDPGNLLLIGKLAGTTVIAAPGCARSPKENGFDWVLERVAAGLTVGRLDIMRMGAGGLLKDTGTRPMPREALPKASQPQRVAAVILAAGRSSRMNGPNKLLLPLDGKAIVAHVVDAVLKAQLSPVVVVTGHQGDEIRAALAGRPVEFVENIAYADGIASSVGTGIGALAARADAALICLGDMPRLQSDTLRQLAGAHDPVEGRSICAPVNGGKRGNPILWDARYFPELMKLKGDTGARHLLAEHEDAVFEVTVEDVGILADVDTPDAFARLTTT